MWKTSIVIVIGTVFLVWGIFSYAGASKQYWEQVGPHWDKLLNPCSHQVCN